MPDADRRPGQQWVLRWQRRRTVSCTAILFGPVQAKKHLLVFSQVQSQPGIYQIGLCRGQARCPAGPTSVLLIRSSRFNLSVRGMLRPELVENESLPARQSSVSFDTWFYNTVSALQHLLKEDALEALAHLCYYRKKVELPALPFVETRPWSACPRQTLETRRKERACRESVCY